MYETTQTVFRCLVKLQSQLLKRSVFQIWCSPFEDFDVDAAVVAAVAVAGDGDDVVAVVVVVVVGDDDAVAVVAAVAAVAVAAVVVVAGVDGGGGGGGEGEGSSVGALYPHYPGWTSLAAPVNKTNETLAKKHSRQATGLHMNIALHQNDVKINCYYLDRKYGKRDTAR